MSRATLSLQTALAVTPGLHERRVGDKVFLLDAKSVMHALENEVAVAIWDVIKDTDRKGVTPGAIAAEILTHFEVSEDRAQEDVLEFVALLRARGIVSWSD
ncbi:MAG: PqqD family protein [Myxococcota bacterium]